MAVKYINSAFLKKVYDKNDSLLIGMGIKKEEFLKDIAALEADDRGWVNLTIGTQKNDKSKYSLWEDDYKKKGSDQLPSSVQPGYRPAPKQPSAYNQVQQGPPHYSPPGMNNSPVDASELPF